MDSPILEAAAENQEAPRVEVLAAEAVTKAVAAVEKSDQNNEDHNNLKLLRISRTGLLKKNNVLLSD